MHGFDTSAEVRESLAKEGVKTHEKISSLLSSLEGSPKIVWMMVPAGAVVDSVIAEVLPSLQKGDILIDGGNSRFSDSVRREKELQAKGIFFLDVGTSGGIGGLANGYCLMIGGAKEAYETVKPIFVHLAPEQGELYTGPSGSGHYTKMVHNGIEYGIMQALAEGFDLLHHSPYEMDLEKVAALWNRGSVLRSWLVELLEQAFKEDKSLDKLLAYVDDSGEGRWTVEEAIARAVPTPVIAASLFARFRSRRENSFGDRVLSALRKQFGGHAVKSK